MEPRQLNRLIRKHFRVTVRGQSCPVGSAVGDRNRLVKLWNEAGYKRGAEIGVQRGYFSRQILKTIPDCHLFSVDPWEYYGTNVTERLAHTMYDQAMERLGPYIEKGRCTIMRQLSMDAVREFADNSLDFAYIDGNHLFDYVVQDIIQWARVVRPGGMIACHDYAAMRRNGVVKAVDAYCHCHCLTYYVTREHLPTAFWINE